MMDQSLPLCRIEMGLGRRAGPPAYVYAFCAGNIMPSNTVARLLVEAPGLLSAKDW
jgi:hypothetical protein